MYNPFYVPNPNKQTKSWKIHVKNLKAKRRAKNKVARKARRINRIRKG